MKKALSWIRWKFVIPAFIFVGLVVVFFALFLDPILAKIIESVGAKINGAKVDVVNLETKIFKGSLRIENFQVADRQAPMTNRFEAGPLTFQLDPGELLKKRVIIPDASINEIRLGTERKTSGALPDRKKGESSEGEPSAVSKLANKYGDRFSLQIENMKTEGKGRLEFDKDDLQITKKSRALGDKIENLPKQWEKKIDDLNFDGRVKNIEQDIESLKETPTSGSEAILGATKAIAKLNQVKADIKKLKEDAQGVRTDFTDEKKEIQQDVSGLKKAKEEDKENLLSRLNLDFADPKRLAEGVIGPAVLSRAQQALFVFQKIRKHLPSKQEKESLPEKPRAEGMTIRFPLTSNPPRFWLKHSGLTGLYKEISLEGALKNLSSNPSKVGQPLVLDLGGVKKGRVFKFNLTADRGGELVKDTLTLEAKNIPINKLTNSGVFGEALQKGVSEAKMIFTATGEKKIDGTMALSLSGLVFDRGILYQRLNLKENSEKYEEKLKTTFADKLATSLEKAPQINVVGKLTGTWSDPELSLETNLLSQMNAIIQSTLGEVVKGQRAELEKRLNAILQERQGEIQAKLNQAQAKIDEKIAKLEKEAQQKLSEASGLDFSSVQEGKGGLPIKVPDLKNIFK